MELVLLLMVAFFIAWALGFLASARKAANMANREMSKLDAKHKVKVIADYKSMTVTEADVTQAKANQALLDSFNI